MFVPLSYNLRSLGQRRTRTLFTVLGIAAVISVYVLMTAVSVKMRAIFARTGNPDELVVTQAGAINPEFSSLARGTGTFLRTHPAVAMTEDGEPLVSPELYLASRLATDTTALNVSVRGVAGIAAKVYRDVRLTAGSFAGPGRRAMVGRQLAQTAGLTPGSTFELEGATWTVAGLFDAKGALYEQEVWVDVDELGAALRRTDLTQFFMRVQPGADAKAIADELSGQRREPVQALTALAAYARVGGMSIWMAALGRFVALVIALGAIFGGMNTMYAAVAARTKEIGILRALGYRSAAVLLSFLLEATALGLVGGALGSLFAFGLAELPLDIPYFIAGSATVGPGEIARGLALSGAVGLFGGFFPAWQASRVVICEVLH